MYNYAATIPGEYILCVYVCVRGLRVCVRECTYASIPFPTYMCTCVRAHMRTRDRTHVNTQLRLCDGSHVGACVFALTGHMRAHVKLCMCLCSACACGCGRACACFCRCGPAYLRFVCACVRTSLYACLIIILYYYTGCICRLSVYVRVCVRVCTYVHANAGLYIYIYADECVYTSVRVWGCSCAVMCVHCCLHVRACALASVGLRL